MVPYESCQFIHDSPLEAVPWIHIAGNASTISHTTPSNTENRIIAISEIVTELTELLDLKAAIAKGHFALAEYRFVNHFGVAHDVFDKVVRRKVPKRAIRLCEAAERLVAEVGEDLEDDLVG